jgi:hypothetical protein
LLLLILHDRRNLWNQNAIALSEPKENTFSGVLPPEQSRSLVPLQALGTPLNTLNKKLKPTYPTIFPPEARSF